MTAARDLEAAILALPCVPKGWNGDERDYYKQGHCEATHAAAALAAAHQSAGAVGVPAGFVLVPIEPTPEMVKAYLAAQHASVMASDQAFGVSSPSKNTTAGYRAMLAAAPAAPLPQPDASDILKIINDQKADVKLRDGEWWRGYESALHWLAKAISDNLAGE